MPPPPPPEAFIMRSVSLPPCGMASRALTQRLISTCSQLRQIGLNRPEIAAVLDVKLHIRTGKQAVDQHPEVADHRSD